MFYKLREKLREKMKEAFGRNRLVFAFVLAFGYGALYGSLDLGVLGVVLMGFLGTSLVGLVFCWMLLPALRPEDPQSEIVEGFTRLESEAFGFGVNVAAAQVGRTEDGDVMVGVYGENLTEEYARVLGAEVQEDDGD